MNRLTVAVTLGFLAFASVAEGQGKPRHEDYALPNGLRVILAEDHSTPLVTVDIWYRVGSRDEQRGKSGLAHLFEHLMSRGSANVADGQHNQLVEATGGESQASVNEDRSAFTQTLPSNQLALGLWLEADRMRSLAITEQTFVNQREQVKQERQVRVDNQPYAAAFLDGVTAAFDSAGCFAYAHSAMGSLEDLDAATVADAQAFFKLHYAPNRATLVVAGDFDPAEARRLVQANFGDIPRGPSVSEASCAVNYAAGERSKEWHDPLAQLPAVITAFPVPVHSDPDSRALQLLTVILGQGERSRLHASLVRDEKVSVQTSAGLESRGGPGLFYAYAIASQGTSLDAVRHALAAQIARLATDVTPAELERARNQHRAASILGRQSTHQLAEEIQHFAHQHASIDEMTTDLDRYAAVTLADLHRVAKKYLVPPNSSVLLVLPAGAETAGAHQHEEDE